MLILSSIASTILRRSSDPEPHLHNENGLHAPNDLTNIMWPCVSAGDTPQDFESGHANPAIAEIFSCSTVHSLRDKLWTLPRLLKLSHCSILSHIYKSVCIPTMEQTGDSCIATVNSVKSNLAAGTGRYERLRGIWNGSQAAELRREKATIKKTRVCSRGGSGWGPPLRTITHWGLGLSLYECEAGMYIGFSATCHMMVVCTCSTLLNISNFLWNALNHLDTNDKSLTLNLHFNSELGDHIDFMQCCYIITMGGLVEGCFQAVNRRCADLNERVQHAG